jgi:transcription elongation GreA/GreB family factor
VNKQNLIEKILEKIQSEMDAQVRAAQAAHEAATHEESRAEDQHDTRGLEASYLAGAQASRAAELQQLIYIYRLLPLDNLPPGARIAPGALVELELETTPTKRSFYFIAPQGGGLTVHSEGVQVQVLTPQSPVGEAIMGRKAGDFIEVEGKGAVREYHVVSVV